MIYLKNKDLLEEIRKSKDTYSSYRTSEDIICDLILPNIERINIRTAAQAKRNRATRLSKQAHVEALAINTNKKKKPILAEFTINWKKILKTDLIFRIYTFEHIPKAPGRVKTPKTESDLHEKLPFRPYKHYRYNKDNELVCVGISHWEGTIKDGQYNKEHGKMTDMLARMFIKLCDRFGTRSNWSGYCVDIETEALTKRGWLKYNEINVNDIILSFTNKNLKWSSVKSIYCSHYKGLMHKLSNKYIDSLITPNHKILTDIGLKPIELLKKTNKVIIMGDHLDDFKKIYSDDEIELIGWITTEKCLYNKNHKNNLLKNITIYQNDINNIIQIRNCLKQLNLDFNEKKQNKFTLFKIKKENLLKIFKILPDKKLSMDFILKLTQVQRIILIDIMILNNGWNYTTNNKIYIHTSKIQIDNFQALCSLSGIKTNSYHVFNDLFGYYVVNLFSKKENKIKSKSINLHGGWKEKNHQNIPTIQYNNTVWCPESEYGTFLARRNGKVYLTGNTYNDEMRGQAIIQLVQVGLLFDEYKSQNPFMYFSMVVKNSFTKILNIERRHQSVRDDILEMNNLNPSSTRQNKSKDIY